MSGIAFKIGSEYLELPAGQKISISLENPLFSDATIPGALSLPFGVLNTPHNLRLLKLSDTLMSFEDTEIVDGVAMYLGGNYWRDGKLIVNSQSPKTINLTFVEFNREDEWENTTLQDLDLPSYDVSEPLVRRARCVVPNSTVFQPTYPNDYSDFYVGMMNRAIGTHGEKDWVCAPVFNTEVQHVSNIEHKYPPAGGTGTDILKIEKNLFQNMFFNGSYCLLCIENIVPTAFGATNVAYDGYFELWDNWAPSHPTNYRTLTLPNAISPFVYLNYILQKIKDRLGLDIPQNFFEQEELRDLVLYTNRANIIFYTGWQNYAINYTNENDKAYFLEKTINLKEYVPKISLANFFKGLKNTFNLNILIDYQSKTLNIQPKNILVQGMKIIELIDKASVYENLQYSSTSSNTAVKLITSIVYAKQDDGISVGDSTNFSIKNYVYKGLVENMAALPTTNNQVNDMYVVAEITNAGGFIITTPLPATNYNDRYSSYKIMIWSNNNEWIEVPIQTYMLRPADITIDATTKNKNELNLAIDSMVERMNALQPREAETDVATSQFCPAVSVPIATQKAVPADACKPDSNYFFVADAYGVPSTTEVISSMKLLFYRGFVGENQDLGFTYKFPYANRTNFRWWKGSTGIKFEDVYEHSLDIDGPKGIFEKYYKNWIAWTRQIRRIATYNLRLQAGEINADLFTNYIQIDSKRFVLKKLTINATPTNILPCKAEMYQIEPSK